MTVLMSPKTMTSIFWWIHQWPSQSDPLNHYQHKSGTSNEKAASFVQWRCQKIVEQAMKEKSAIKNLNFLINLAMVTNNTRPLPEDPKTFNEAWDHPNWEAICKGFLNMKKQQVWCITNKRLVPLICRCIKEQVHCQDQAQCYCVPYQACLMACRGKQGTWHQLLQKLLSGSQWCYLLVLLLIVLYFGYSAKIVHVETNFLYGDWKKKFMWNVPKVCPT